MTEELEQKAEDFIIDRYKIAECYREDNAETREYMRNDVHSQYEEESQLYIAGAEPREKRIAELEESNKEWQRTCEAKSDTNSQLTEQLADKVEEIAELERKLEQTEKDLSDYQFNYPSIKELQKENAELKYQLNKNPCVCNTEWHCNDCLEQLTKAKEILKDITSSYGSTEVSEAQLYLKIKKAELFLNEVEK